MYEGFRGLCEDFLRTNPGCFISPIRVNGSAVESIFSSLKFISGGNLSLSNYASSLASLITQKDCQNNPHSEQGYRTDIGNINCDVVGENRPTGAYFISEFDLTKVVIGIFGRNNFL